LKKLYCRLSASYQNSTHLPTPGFRAF
jgi:hypothetical protein